MRYYHAALSGRESQEHPIILAGDFSNILCSQDINCGSLPQKASDNRVTEVLVGEPPHRLLRLANNR